MRAQPNEPGPGLGAGRHPSARAGPVRAGHLRAARTIAADVAVVSLAVVAYFGTRGLTAGSPQVAQENALDVLRLERALGLDVEAEVQAAMLTVDGLATAANWIYIWGHWPVIVLTLLWLAVRNRVVFRRLRNAIIASGVLGLCVYTTYPVAPPRLAGLGFVDTVTETSRAYRVLQPPAFVNQYAAMPSLHVGWDLLVGLALVTAAGASLVRVVGWTMPSVMAAATVLTANHYVLDVVAGAAFGMAGWWIALLVERRSQRRQQRELGRERRLLHSVGPPGLERRSTTVPGQRGGAPQEGPVDGPWAAACRGQSPQ